MSAREPVACSLAAGEMAERRAELRAVFGGSLIEVVRDGDALRVELLDSPGLGERLDHVIDLERACCPFLDPAVEREAGRLVVRIAGPPEAAAVIDLFDELVSDSRQLCAPSSPRPSPAAKRAAPRSRSSAMLGPVSSKPPLKRDAAPSGEPRSRVRGGICCDHGAPLA